MPHLYIPKFIISDIKDLNVPLGKNYYSIAFNSIYADNSEENIYLYFAFSRDKEWLNTNLGVMVFDKTLSTIKTVRTYIVDECYNCVTPLLLKVNEGKYILLYASGKPRKICMAISDNPLGPFRYKKVVIKPSLLYRSPGIDLGPGLVKVGVRRYIVYFSNIGNPRWLLRLKALMKLDFKEALIGIDLMRYVRRYIFLALIEVDSDDVKVHRLLSLKHLNGPLGSWCESLFCPGYLRYKNLHLLLPAASTYSVGYPYRQYIGMIVGSSPFFDKIIHRDVLIDGAMLAKRLTEGRTDVALDTPAPIKIGNKLYIIFSYALRREYKWNLAIAQVEEK